MALNRLKAKVAQNQALLGAWVIHGNEGLTEVISSLGYDVVCLDLQHGSFADANTASLIRAIADRAVPFVRTLNGEDGNICRALDAGAMGIICPMVNTKADCESFVAACLYPPIGHRSCGMYRADMMRAASEGVGAASGDSALVWSNKNVMSFAMVETTEALDNLEEILSVPHLTGVFVGPNDLGLRLGHAPSSSPTGDVLKAIIGIKELCHKKNKLVGIFAADGDTGNAMVQAGFNYVNLFSDINGIYTAGRNELSKIRS